MIGALPLGMVAPIFPELAERLSTAARGRVLGAPLIGAEIVAKAREMIGVRYGHQGRSRERLDCIGLPALVRAELGLVTLDVTNYAARATDESMLEWCRENMLSVHDLQPGDILVMAYGRDRHMAIVGDYPHGGFSIIHAYIDNRRVVENRLDESFMARVIGRFRFPEVQTS